LRERENLSPLREGKKLSPWREKSHSPLREKINETSLSLKKNYANSPMKEVEIFH
jgi:hypothetical protein